MAKEHTRNSEQCRAVDGGITHVFEVLGKRWNGPILSVLLGQPAHFASLRRAIPGISERMLSDRLAELGIAGLVVREVDEGPPLRVSMASEGFSKPSVVVEFVLVRHDAGVGEVGPVRPWR
ncbi:helix-turn-helix domain-containing protein, partial [Streptomyces sp. NPDC048279]|uniref:winged helix-turn-helix transcriptional regulator n=1 Tax=Streptomyces sp. NPDC048279 TaxID=3154714 RepID=UPI0034320BF4